MLPALLTSWWLWLLLPVVVAIYWTDRQVQWENPRLKTLAAATVSSKTVATAVWLGLIFQGLLLFSGTYEETFPGSDSVLWPLGWFAVVLFVLRHRVRVMRVLGPDYNGDLATRRDQVVIDTGPYARVRHPGYRAVVLTYTALVLAFGFWPLVVFELVVMAPLLRARILKEERINCAGIDGYAEYMERVRWRVIPNIW